MNRRQAIWTLAILAAAGGAALAASVRKNSVFEPPITPMPAFSPEPSATLVPKATSTGKPEVPVTPEKNQVVEIILGGDILLGRTVMNTSFELNDPRYPFLKIADTLREADITFFNLEGPIIDKCPVVPFDARMIFCADPKMAEGLVYARVDVVSLANNHTLDHGESGFAQTQETLKKNGIEYVGLGNLAIREVKGTKFGFLGFDFVSKYATDEDFELIKEADKNVDVLIIGVHWGGEYETTPREIQRQLAKKMIENGADVIVGHHPHVLQPFEKIDGVPVYYSLGNTIFDPFEWDEQGKKGMLVGLIFDGSKIIGEEFLPTYMFSHAQPEFVNNGQ